MIGAVVLNGLISSKLPYILEGLTNINCQINKCKNISLCSITRDIIVNTNFRHVDIPNAYLGKQILFIYFDNPDIYNHHRSLLSLDNSFVMPRGYDENVIWESLHI